MVLGHLKGKQLNLGQGKGNQETLWSSVARPLLTLLMANFTWSLYGPQPGAEQEV